MPEAYVAKAVVREGRALIQIPDPSMARAPHGLEPAWLPVFYNPRMVFNRDLSVAAIAAYARLYAPTGELWLAEPLTATGVRSVRYALEVPTIALVEAGDIDPEAVWYARANASLNKVEGRVRVRLADARELLHASRRELGKPFNIIDIDPFGSPAPFLDAAAANIAHKGLLALTATDLAVLEGSKSRAAARKYHVRIVKTPESKEIGLRVLVGYAARVLAAHDKAATPILSYYADHYYRVYILVERGARRADRIISDCMGFLDYCPRDGRTYLHPASCASGEKPLTIGPVWTCKMNDREYIERISDLVRGEYSYLETRERILSLLETLASESTLEEGRLHMRIEQAASYARVNMPRRDELLSRLKERGYRAVRSHYGPTSIRTDATFQEVTRLLVAP